jgi:quinol monooxygenase YgiN
VGGLTVAAIFEAEMSAEQARQLAELMREARPTRPEGVVTAALHVEDGTVRLVAYWRDRETLDAYLATAEVPRGVELMRKVGVEPTWRIVDVLELG